MPIRVATLVLFHNGYGDYVMALPALRALCASSPRPLAFVFGEGPHLFLTRELNPDRQIEVPYVNLWPRKDFDPAPVLEQIDGCDWFVSLCPYDCSGQDALRERLRPRQSVGFMPGFDTRLDYETAATHEFDVLFQAATHIAPAETLDAHSSPVRFQTAADDAARRMRTALNGCSALIVVHADTRPDKMFPRERFDRILRRWLADDDGRFAILLNESRRNWPAASASGRCGFLVGASLERSMAVAQQADLFVGVDSCMLHVADLARRPGIGLFGPTHPQRYGFRFSPRATVRELRAGSDAGTWNDDAIFEAGNQLIGLVESRLG